MAPSFSARPPRGRAADTPVHPSACSATTRARRGGGAATRARALGTPVGRDVGCFIVVGRAYVVFGRIFVQDVGVARRDVHRGVQVRLRKPVAASRGTHPTGYARDACVSVGASSRRPRACTARWERREGTSPGEGARGDAHARMVETTGRGGRRGGSCGGADLDLGIRRRTAVRARRVGRETRAAETKRSRARRMARPGRTRGSCDARVFRGSVRRRRQRRPRQAAANLLGSSHCNLR